jgi:hypothetical protein
VLSSRKRYGCQKSPERFDEKNWVCDCRHFQTMAKNFQLFFLFLSLSPFLVSMLSSPTNSFFVAVMTN